MGQVTIEHRRGVGSNAVWDVLVDGIKVAQIRRLGVYRGWGIVGKYEMLLGQADKSAEARALAATLTYPTAAEAFENRCRTVYERRKRQLTQRLSVELHEAALKTLDGSNSGRAELATLCRDIEAVASDRTNGPHRFKVSLDRYPMPEEARQSGGASK